MAKPSSPVPLQLQSTVSAAPSVPLKVTAASVHIVPTNLPKESNRCNIFSIMMLETSCVGTHDAILGKMETNGRVVERVRYRKKHQWLSRNTFREVSGENPNDRMLERHVTESAIECV